MVHVAAHTRNVYVQMLNVQWKTPDDGQRNCPKHVEFLDKNNFGKLARLLVLLKRNTQMVFDNSGKTSIWTQDRGSDKTLQNIAR